MHSDDQHHEPPGGRNSPAAEARAGDVWPCPWLTSAVRQSWPIPLKSGSDASIDPPTPCWMSGLDAEVLAVLASPAAPSSEAQPAPERQSPAPRGARPAVICGLLVLVYLSMAAFTGICAWRQPGSGIFAVVPVMVLGGWVILHPIPALRLRRRAHGPETLET